MTLYKAGSLLNLKTAGIIRGENPSMGLEPYIGSNLHRYIARITFRRYANYSLYPRPLWVSRIPTLESPFFQVLRNIMGETHPSTYGGEIEHRIRLTGIIGPPNRIPEIRPKKSTWRI